LAEIGIQDAHIVLEPVAKNTAPTIALAAKFALEKLNTPEDEVLFISPSDRIISPNEKFAEYMKKAEKIAKEGYIIIFNIKPTKPETGYGYIEAKSIVSNSLLVNGMDIIKLHEKPGLEIATKYIEKNYQYINNKSINYYFWNSGMFAFSIGTILEEFKQYEPKIYEKIESRAFEDVLRDFQYMPEVFIDYAAMEKTNKAVVLPLDIEWPDAGSWDAFYDAMKKDENGNVKIEDVVNIGATH